MTPKEHIRLIQLETRLIRARLQFKAAIAYQLRNPNQSPEQKESTALMIECARLVMWEAKEAIALHNLGCTIDSDGFGGAS
jgi:hypothetical protein